MYPLHLPHLGGPFSKLEKSEERGVSGGERLDGKGIITKENGTEVWARTALEDGIE